MTRFLLADGIINRLTAERDHARDVACALEAEVARLTEALERIEAAAAAAGCKSFGPLAHYPGCIARKALKIDHGEMS